MPYTNVISLASAKDYLGVDDTSRDAEITRMIESALKFLEKRTNIIMQPQTKDYVFVDNCVRVYDHPINTPDNTLPDGVTREVRPLYSVYTTTDSTIKTLQLNVGNQNVDNDIMEAGYMLIEHYFQEGQRTPIPMALEQIININRRFII